MKKVLIATTNKDKYRIVKDIFQATIFPQEEYLINSLKEINVELEDKKEGRLEPNIKEYINKIPYEEYLSDGEEYAFSRAYCIVDREGNIKETVAEIPYIYKENKNIIRAEYSDPLSEVAFPIGYDVPLTSLTPKEELNYYLKYVKEPLEQLKI